MTRFSAPYLIVVQSRLYSPGYGGMGRWVIVQPRTRQAFSAVGLDVIPDVITLLAAASAGADEKALRLAAPRTSADQIERLEEVGLLVNSDEPGDEPGESMLWHYHLASYDYPFLDYADPDWREDEDQIIKSYARMWPPPPPIDTYTGESFSLPPPSSESLNVGLGLSLEVLATILHYTFAPIGEIPTQAVTCIRRTSPSGGARHPTECRVILPEGCGALAAGVYLYDNGHHALVRETGEKLDSYGQYKDARVVFVLRSKVERAMWRYRDLRALRPVLLDAGHIVETLSLLLTKAGIDAQMCPPPLVARENFDWLAMPDFVAVVAPKPGGGEIGEEVFQSSADPYISLLQDADGNEFLTNPAFFMKFRDGKMRGFSVWPERITTDLDLLDFRVLSHCLPSNRGDRVTTEEGIREAVPGLKSGRVGELLERKALLKRTTAQAFYDATKLWVRYGWYLSELTHLETVSALRSNLWQESVRARNYMETLEPLFKRKTCRKFADSPVKLDTLNMLIGESLVDVPLNAESGLRLFAVGLDVPGLGDGLYEWRHGLEPVGTVQTSFSRDKVRQLTIGQFPAGAGAAVVWLARRQDCDNPATYELNIVEMGRIGQRICLLATEMGLGVFMTPAVSDGELERAFRLEDPLSTVFYLFAIGIPYDREKAR